MKSLTPSQIYNKLKQGGTKYEEDKHCLMILEILPVKWRISSFCIEVLISESTFYNWVNRYPVFKSCYCVAQFLAHEAWEKEEVDNKGNPEWDRKAWISKGTRYFVHDKSKLKLEVDPTANPWEQYQQILRQAEKGDFNASEIKQLMESVNVGTRVYETFKLQVELDKMKEDFNEMSQRHGNNPIAVVKNEGLGFVKLDLTVATSAYVTDYKKSGCSAKNHPYHKDREESLIVIYEQLFKLFDELHAEAPNLYIDCTFETAGKLQLIDYAFCQHAEGNWLTNIGEPFPVGAFRIRNLTWWKSPAIPATSRRRPPRSA